jgi:putative SOS response-associated peptidase YedK
VWSINPVGATGTRWLISVSESVLGDYVRRFNIAPTQAYLILKTKYESREAIPAALGLVKNWAKVPVDRHMPDDRIGRMLYG